ncbi:isocitrate lyase/PEP mutase family protein [Aerobium aerolatum]|uniref:2-Methylisocitrate lyase, PEP mutase family n=1 Tax=Aquamicrobium aerolatum DSM 21857 TaxID=1121003 RepID=A0A1I3SIN5_9HYPH|nr:isocitrate lyase/PEP mutase family protein [Aquamicrobium aerolatum]SFJ58578.1 2-Methylisocitrate lyase, PEP mutase family [Aquamicrobium aerolatum DSM 21857]
MTKTKVLRTMFSAPDMLLCMGAYDALSARLAEQAGFNCIYLGGFAAATSMLGVPDLGILTLPEMADHIRRIAAVTTKPIIADADNGHGNAVNTARTIAMFEAAGASGIHMEDQVLPKKCGHVAGKVLVPTEDMINKLKAAQQARSDKDFVIIVRTDAIAVDGLDAAIDRAKRYADAGADALFLDAPESMEHLDRIGKELASTGKPLVFNAASTGKTPEISVEQCRAFGFHVILYPIEPLLAAMDGAKAVMKAVLETGELTSVRHRMANFTQIKNAVGFPEAEALDIAFPMTK